MLPNFHAKLILGNIIRNPKELDTKVYQTARMDFRTPHQLLVGQWLMHLLTAGQAPL